MLKLEQHRTLHRALISACVQFEHEMKTAEGQFLDYVRERHAQAEAALAVLRELPIDLADWTEKLEGIAA